MKTGYDLWDKNAYDNNSGSRALDSSGTIAAGATLTITTLGFGINDSNETIYLTNPSGDLIDQKGN